jgi:hypothetical protein
MRVPHEIRQQTGNNHLFGVGLAHIEKFNVGAKGGFEGQDIVGKLSDEFMLPETGSNQPLLVTLARVVIVGVKPVNCAHRAQIHVFLVEIHNIF